MFSLIQKLILLIPFWMRATLTEWLHPDCRSISYTFITQPYSEIEIKALGLDESTLIIHNDIIDKLVEKENLK